MKTLTKITVLVAGLAVAALPLLAATDATKRAHRANRAQQLDERPVLRALVRHQAVRKHVARKLDLTPDQISQLKATRGETREAIKAIRSDASLTPEQKKVKAREILQSTRGKVRGMLSAEQQDKAGKMRQRLRAMRHRAL